MALTWFRNKSLSFKINLLGLTFILILIILGISMYQIAQKSLQQELITRGHVIVRRLAESHSYQVSLGLADELKPIIDKLMSEKGIWYVEFVDLDGRVIQTGDGQFKAQSDPAQRRPSEFYKFDLKSISERPEGVRIQA